jgi:hypothetical protein
MTAERRPPFASEFPRIEELDRLVDAFERGDFARVRAGAPRLADTTTDEAVRKAARELHERTKPDPLAVRLMALTAVLLLLLTAYWVVNGKPPPTNAPTKPAVERAK